MSFDVSSRRRSLQVRRGATLVEQLIVITIIGMLMALLFVAFRAVLPTSLSGGRNPRTLEMATVLAGAPNRPKRIVPDEYIIQFDATVANPAAVANKVVGDFGKGKVVRVYNSRWLKGCHVQIPGVTLAALGAHPAVKYAGPETLGYPDQDMVPTGVSRIQEENHVRQFPNRTRFNPELIGRPDLAPLPAGGPSVHGALVKTTNPGSVVVAVIDSGVDADHVDLNVTLQRSFVVPAVAGDTIGHGTHVAGTIGARLNGTGVVGVCPGCQIWDLKVFDINTTIETDAGGNAAETAIRLSRVIDALLFVLANANRIDVCNMSFSFQYNAADNTPPLPPELILNALTDACTTAGVIMVTSAGNNGVNIGLINANARAPNTARTVVCVGAFGDTDGMSGGDGPLTSENRLDDDRANTTNFGSVVDVVAPGVDVLSTLPGNEYGDIYTAGGVIFANPNTATTSVASAHVAGIMALYCQRSRVITNFGRPPQSRRPTGLEIVSLFIRNRGPEFIRLQDGLYPTMIVFENPGG